MNTQTKVLKKITKMFMDEYVPAIFLQKNEAKGIPTDMVSLLYTEYGTGDGEVNVDILFLPIPAAEGGSQYLATVIKIAEDIDEIYRPNLIQAINILNFITPFGCYILSPDSSELTYKLVTPMPGNLTEEQLLTQTNLTVANALDMAERFVGVLQNFVKGKATLEDIAGLI